jgi:hypothetical protein
MRTFLTSAMAVLVIVALFWGNCLSCPQVLSAAAHHRSSHGCCPKSQQSKDDCQTQVLRHFVKADPGVTAPALATVGVAQQGVPPAPELVALVPATPLHFPPDLVSLNSSFRI